MYASSYSLLMSFSLEPLSATLRLPQHLPVRSPQVGLLGGFRFSLLAGGDVRLVLSLVLN